MIKIVFYLFVYLSYNLHCLANLPNYSTQFGQCPKKRLGAHVLSLVKLYEKDSSLFKMNNLLTQNKNDFFLNHYDVNVNTRGKKLQFNFSCPQPLFKIVYYTDNKARYSKDILVHTGEVFHNQNYDFEQELLAESIINQPLPVLSIDSEIAQNESILITIANKIANIPTSLKDKVSEMIFTNKSIILVISHQKGPIEVYFENANWDKTIQNGLNSLVELISQQKSISKMYLGLENKVIVRLKKISL